MMNKCLIRGESSTVNVSYYYDENLGAGYVLCQMACEFDNSAQCGVMRNVQTMIVYIEVFIAMIS